MKLRLGEVWLSHSDRGCQYSATVTRELLATRKLLVTRGLRQSF